MAKDLINKLIGMIVYPISQPYRIAQGLMLQSQRSHPEVDLLKGLSVLMIILFHVFFAVVFLYKDDWPSLSAFIQSMPSWLSFVFSFDKAVDIFFLLSSFLLTIGLLGVYKKKVSIHIRRFYLHRFFRLYPLFLVALILYGLGDINKLISAGIYSLLFIENIVHKPIIPVQWSLSVEVQFYLILPFLLLFLVRCKRPILLLSLLILGSIGLRYWIVQSTPGFYQTHWYALINTPLGSDYMNQLYYVIEARVTPLLMGILWGWLVFYYADKRLTLSNLNKFLLISLTLVVLYLSMRFPVYDPNAWYYQHFNETVNLWAITLHRIVFSAAILGLVLVLFFTRPGDQTQLSANKNPSFNRIFKSIQTWSVWRLLSELAYPMYFFHFPFVALAWVIILGTTNLNEITSISLWLIPFVFILAVTMTLYLSLWLHHWVEARFIQVGKRIESKWFGGHNASNTKTNTVNKPE